MDRPKYVSDAIETSPDGLHVGRYGPFRLHCAYQPIYRYDRGRLVAAAFEGLVRPDRDGQPVAPDAMFENIDSCDRLFIECMCRALHLRNYRNASPADLDLFINVDPSIYESIEVVEREFEFMFSILDKYGLSPGRLVCEIVEKEALDMPSLLRLCAKFRARGARVAIDDFGSGSSSFIRYRELQADVVKVDGAIFRGLSADRGGRQLLGDLMRCFRQDGATLLIEGIETTEQLRVGFEMGATLFQGFGLARPHRLPNAFPDVAALDLQPRRTELAMP